MFGLMRERTRGLSPEEKLRRRLDYCGTCKTMGLLYGHASRALLNHDTVFMAEVLSALAGADPPPDAWDPAYRSYNCLALPEGEGSAPVALAYAATITVLLAEAKVDDHCADAPGAGWALARRALSGRASSAAARLEAWDFPLAEFRAWTESQRGREAEVAAGRAPVGDPLDYLAEPTAAVTGLTLRHGARLVGRPDRAAEAYELGHAFGRLVYLLDAFTDYERDERRGEFNAFRAASAEGENAPRRGLAAVRVRAEQAAVERALARMAIPPERAARFVARLRASLLRELREPLPTLQPNKCMHRKRRALRERWRAAVALGRTIAARHFSGEKGMHPAVRTAERPVVLASAVTAAFLFPAHAATAASYRECMEVGMNVMALGALAGAVAGSVRRVSLPFRRKKRPAQEGGVDSGGGSDCCDWCECCECGCEGCDCCGSCDCCDCCDCKCD